MVCHVSYIEKITMYPTKIEDEDEGEGEENSKDFFPDIENDG